MRLFGSTLNGRETVIISDCNSLVCDNGMINAALVNQGLLVFRGGNNNLGGSFENQAGATVRLLGDRKSVVEGKRVGLGCRGGREKKLKTGATTLKETSNANQGVCGQDDAL